MIQIANIYGVKNQELYSGENFVMILAHLAKKNLYKPESFSKNAYIIMDNGLYEKAQVSTSVDDVVEIADQLPFHIDELIIPDVVNDYDANIDMFKSNLEQIKKHNDKYTFMFVAQSQNEQELEKAINFINQYYGYLNLTVGISKLCPFNRASIQAIEVYKKCKFPIHFLGIKSTFKELMFTQNTTLRNLIRSCDTSQLEYIAKNEHILPVNVVDYTRTGRAADGRGVDGVDIELETDFVDSNKLKILKKRFEEQFYTLTIFEYENFVKNSASPKYDNKLAIIGLVGEVGELADVVKKQTIYEDMSQFEQKYHMSVVDKIKDEAGDVLWQFTLVLSLYGLSLEEVMNQNYLKLITRHGGVKTSKNGGGLR